CDSRCAGMVSNRLIRRTIVGVLSLALAVSLGSTSGLPSTSDQTDKRVDAEINPREHALDANLYMQTSGEYRALCLQIYEWSTERLKARLHSNVRASKRPA